MYRIKYIGKEFAKLASIQTAVPIFMDRIFSYHISQHEEEKILQDFNNLAKSLGLDLTITRE